MILIIKLLLAHLIGDFLLQPNSWVRSKEQKKEKAWQLYAHTLIHGILSMVIVWDRSFWFGALLIATIHLIIDWIKVTFQKDETKRRWFIIDQLLHFITLILIAIWYNEASINLAELATDNNFILLTLSLLLTKPTSILVKTIISIWTPPNDSDETESLQNAGNYIGIIERLLVFLFIVNNRWEAVGFLITAKSVFRFGELKEAKDRKLTEYVLIGTMLSFGIAIIIGLIYLKLSPASTSP